MRHMRRLRESLCYSLMLFSLSQIPIQASGYATGDSGLIDSLAVRVARDKTKSECVVNR